MSMNRQSIGLRLVVGAAAWIVVALLLTVWFLTAQFREHVQHSFDTEISGHLSEMLLQLKADPNGRAFMTRHTIDPRTSSPYSGWYWIVTGPDQKPLRSRSVWDQEIPLPTAPPVGVPKTQTIDGPQQRLRVISQTVTLPGSKNHFTVYVTGPQNNVDKAIKKFFSLTALALGILGLGLFGAVLIQVIFGLRPLNHIREALADINAGRTARLEGSFPSEVVPLVDELNGLLAHNAKVLERARTHVGNLAHALKTPVAVLRNLSSEAEGNMGETLRHQTEEMNTHVTHHLRRARMAGSSGLLGVRTEVCEVSEKMINAMGRIFNDKPRKGTLAGQRGMWFHGERQDLEELLGNLIENAFKWSESQVRVTISPGTNTKFPIRNRIIIEVEDDGPGIPAEKRAEAMGRGKRLDETTPGTGLGLSIVNDLAEMYEGAFSLEESEWGGLKSVLDLPAAPEEKPENKSQTLSEMLHLPQLGKSG